MHFATIALRFGHLAVLCFCGAATLPGQLLAQAPDKFPAGPIQYGLIDTRDLTLDKPVYAAGEYSNLRELYRLMLAHQGERLLLRKKAGD